MSAFADRHSTERDNQLTPETREQEIFQVGHRADSRRDSGGPRSEDAQTNTGAGSASRNAIGTGVAGGMLAATALGIFLIPVFYVVVRRIFKLRRKHGVVPQPDIEGPAGSKEPIV